jgi:hypothetical protein
LDGATVVGADKRFSSYARPLRGAVDAHSCCCERAAGQPRGRARILGADFARGEYRRRSAKQDPLSLCSRRGLLRGAATHGMGRCMRCTPNAPDETAPIHRV